MITREKVPVEGLLESYEAALMQTGYSITTKLLLIRRADLMIRQHLNEGMVYFDQSVINRYLREIDDRYFRVLCRKNIMSEQNVKSTVSVSYVCTGRIDALSSTLRGARQELTPTFKQIAEEFIAGFSS